MSEMSESEEFIRKCMARAIEIARGGAYTTSPNPRVGAVIFRDGKIIGEGYHRLYGGPHAEVNAVNSVADRSLLRGASICVTLEPCSHYGKTPPCARLLIECGFGHVIIGASDPNPKVAGKGVRMLREAGIKVDEGVMEAEALALNPAFHLAHTLKRPRITLKWARSADGWLDHKRGENAMSPASFSTPLTRLEVMKLRASNDAILVGANTVIADDPALTIRSFPGRNPLRVVLDRRGRVAASSKVFADNRAMILYVSCVDRRSELPDYVESLIVDESVTLAQLVARLYADYQVTSLLVEGGAEIHRSFIEAQLADVIRVETSPVVLGDRGCVRAPDIPSEMILRDSIEVDGNRLSSFQSLHNQSHHSQ